MGKGTNSDDWMMLRVCVHMMMVGCGVHLWVHVGSPSAGPPLCGVQHNRRRNQHRRLERQLHEWHAGQRLEPHALPRAPPHPVPHATCSVSHAVHSCATLCDRAFRGETAETRQPVVPWWNCRGMRRCCQFRWCPETIKHGIEVVPVRRRLARKGTAGVAWERARIVMIG